MKKRMGFTLVEMLTVVVIIGILASITMRLMVYVNEKTGKTRASRDIEQIKHALTEYYAFYGIYPPASQVAWEFENPMYAPPAKPDKGMGFYDGLATYLYGDPQAKKWIHFVEEIKWTGVILRKGSSSSAGNMAWSNNYCSIKDPWERDYIYETSDPYQAFKLYSLGPDGVENTADDIGASKFTE
jgi:prepilin-type N-terminal cleavage/methylation domain-containing protein